MQVKESFKYKTRWVITKYADDAAFAAGKAFDQAVIDGNMLLNAGITLLLQLLIGGGGTVYSNANARLGVGDSTTAEAATQTTLIGDPNALFKAMSATYPQVAGQTVTFRAVFTGAEANYAWQEFVVDNGTTALNRKVSDQGTKAAGQTWTLDLAITIA